MKSNHRIFQSAQFAKLAFVFLIAFATLLSPKKAQAQSNPLVGVWYMQTAVGSNKIAIQNDGTYAKLDIGGSTTFYSAGTYAVYPSQQLPILRLNVLQCAPRQPFGCPLASENYMFTVNAQELRLWDQNGGPYILHRIQ